MAHLGRTAAIFGNMVEHERKNDFGLNWMRRLRYLSRYFADSGIIVPKEIVSNNYRKFKDRFMTTRQKITKLVSEKRLAE